MVVFQADPEADHGADSPSSDDRNVISRRDKVTVRKAIECGLELLARLSNYRIYLSEREYSRKLSGGSGPSSGDDPHSPGDDGNNGNVMNMNNSQSGNSSSSWNANASGFGPVSSSTSSIGASSFLSVPQGRPNSNGGSSNSSIPRRSSVPNNSVSPMTTTAKFSSGTNLDALAMTGLYGNGNGNNNGSNGNNSTYRKREESIMSSRPGSTTSKHNRATNFFANAKQLFTNSNVNDRLNTVPAEEMSEDSLELQLHMAMTAGPICKFVCLSKVDMFY